MTSHERTAPGGLAFPTPIDVQVDGERRRCAMLQGWVRLPLPSGAEVLVNPDWWVLRGDAPSVDHFGTLGLRAVPLDVARAGRRTGWRRRV